MRKPYTVSIIFGSAPLVVGILVFALWYFTRADVLITAGIFTMIGGLFSVLIAVTSLVVFLWCQPQKKITGKVLLTKGVFSAIIIISNFPVAYFCASAAVNIMTQYILTIENQSISVITNVTILAPGINDQVESVKPNEKIVLKLNFKGDGVLEFEAKQSTG